MTLFRVTAVLLLLLWPATALAQSVPLQPVPPGDDVIVAVKKGDTVPLAGQLFDQATAIRWGNYLEQCRTRLVADVELQKKVDEAQITYLNQVLELERSKYKQVVGDYQVRLGKAEAEVLSPPFYKTVWFGVTLGVLATLILTIATGYVISAVGK